MYGGLCKRIVKLEILIVSNPKNNDLKKSIKENKENIDKLKELQNMNYQYFKDSLKAVERLLKESNESKNYLEVEIKRLSDSFDGQYENQKEKLNEHYYALQRAFNDFVKAKGPNLEPLKELENICTQLHSRVKEVEDKMTAMFFVEPKSPKEKRRNKSK